MVARVSIKAWVTSVGAAKLGSMTIVVSACARSSASATSACVTLTP